MPSPATGIPESGQTVVNVTNGKLIRLLVDDEPFDIALRPAARPRAGAWTSGPACCDRSADWVSPAGCGGTGSYSTRLVSFIQRVGRRDPLRGARPLDSPIRVVVQSELLANEQLPPTERGPAGGRRARAAAGRPRRTPRSAPAAGAGAPHQGTAACAWPRRWTMSSTAPAEHRDRQRRPTRTSAADHGDRDARARAAAAADQVRGLRLVGLPVAARACAIRPTRALAGARQTGWDGPAGRAAGLPGRVLGPRRRRDRRATPRSSRRCGSALFHVLQAGARAEGRAIPAKGLTGPGYDGHAFWDTETYVLPVLTYIAARPRRADALRWRHSTLDRWPRERAPSSGWRARRSRGGPSTARNAPATGRPARPAFHVNADIADAVVRLRRRPPATTSFERERRPGAAGGDGAAVALAGPPRPRTGRFHIDGVTGPDEYSAVADDNVYTNLMAQQNLRAAADAAERHPDLARGSASTTRRWRAGGTPPRPCTSRTTGSSACTRSPTASPATRCGTSPPPPPDAVPAAAALPVLRSVPQAGGQAGRPGAGHVPCAATRSPPEREGPQLRLLRTARPCGTRRCRPAPRRCMAAEVRSPASWPTTTSPRPP